MAWRFPNRTAELGVMGSGVIALSGSALPGMRTFAAALSALRIADGDRVGVSLSASSDPSRWAVWQADYSGAGTLTLVAVEDASPQPIAAGETVQVVAVITGQVMAWLEVVEPDPVVTYFDGPDYWTPAESEAEWDATEGAYRILSGSVSWGSTAAMMSAAGAWAAGFRPTTISVDIWVPPEEDLEARAPYTGVMVRYAAGAPEFVGLDFSARQITVQHGWNTLTGPIDENYPPSDIVGLVLLAGGEDERAGYRWRRILFTE